MENIIKLKHIKKINGEIILPGSKYLSNKILLLSAICKGKTNLKNILYNEDILIMLNALNKIGIKYKTINKNTYEINGINGVPEIEKTISIFSGNTSTVIRSLSALLSIGKNNIILTGNKKIKKKPIGHLIDALKQGGAKIKYLEKYDYPPILIEGGFQGGKLEVNSSLSSQFLCLLLICSPLAKKDTFIKIKNNILISLPYIKMTLSLIKKFGVNIFYCNKNKHFIIKGQQKYISPGEITIEGDALLASYFLTAGAIKGGNVKVIGINKKSLQEDIKFINVLDQIGVKINFGKNFISIKKNNKKTINPLDINLNKIPNIAIILIIYSLFIKGTSIIKNIYNWKIKENNRLAVITKELKKTGAKIKEGKNYLKITSDKKIKHAIINTYNDYRIAMCFSLLSLNKNSVSIINPECIKNTYPNYFIDLYKLNKS